MSKRLKHQDYIEAAKRLNCEVAALMAVASVESRGAGFDENDRIILRFEGHKFRQFTRGKYDQSHPHLSYPYRVQHLKQHGYAAFNEAFQLDQTAALLATSFGMFQPMGFTHEEAGFDNVHEFVDFLKVSEKNQLIVFVAMVKFRKLTDEIQRKDFAGFAKNYNGERYKDNNYDVKMERAYKRFKLYTFSDINDQEIEAAVSPASNPPIATTDEEASIGISPPAPTQLEGEIKQGDPPAEPPKAWLNVEDWKPWVFSKLKILWSSFGGGNFTQLTATTFAALNAGENWWIPVLIGLGIFLITLIICGVISLVLLLIWHFNRKEISEYIKFSKATLIDPNVFNLGLNFEKIGVKN